MLKLLQIRAKYTYIFFNKQRPISQFDWFKVHIIITKRITNLLKNVARWTPIVQNYRITVNSPTWYQLTELRWNRPQTNSPTQKMTTILWFSDHIIIISDLPQVLSKVNQTNLFAVRHGTTCLPLFIRLICRPVRYPVIWYLISKSQLVMVIGLSGVQFGL